MPEHDLKLICQNIPVNDSGSVSTQANAILKGISGQDVEFDIQTGGSQPTLYPPILSTGFNVVSVNINSTNNGAFVTNNDIHYYIDNVEVSGSGRQYIVQSQDNGKMLAVHLSATDFNDGIATVTLTYINPSSDEITITVNISDAVTTNLIYYTTAYSSSNVRYLNSKMANNDRIIWWIYDYSTTTLYLSSPIMSIYYPTYNTPQDIYGLIGYYYGVTTGWLYTGSFGRGYHVSDIITAFNTAVSEYSTGYNVSIPSFTAGTRPNYNLEIISNLSAKQDGIVKSSSSLTTNIPLANNNVLNTINYPHCSSSSSSGTVKPADGNITFTGSVVFNVTVSQ